MELQLPKPLPTSTVSAAPHSTPFHVLQVPMEETLPPVAKIKEYSLVNLSSPFRISGVKRVIIFDLLKVVPTIEGGTVRGGIVLGGTVCGGAAVWGTNGLGVILTGGSLAGDGIRFCLRCGLGCTLDGGSFAIDGVWFCPRSGLEGTFVAGSFAGKGV